MFQEDGLLYPDSVVGTDSHTTMINGLGIVGWGQLLLIVITYMYMYTCIAPNIRGQQILSYSYSLL